MTWLGQLIAARLIQAVVAVFTLIPVALFGLAERLLRFILGPNFISVPYTRNEFVIFGWGLTRDLANIFFIIFLVIIGLATALRISEYQWQKTLPLLIGIALLINFTPVILGLIIDASNIIMNFFTSGIAEGGFFVSRMEAYLDSITNMIKGADWTEPGSYFAILVAPSVYAIFNLMAAIIYFLFCILFILRYVALWTLIILSPIAFLCYILPHTRRIFSLWWNQFLQWCIIGIAAAFVIYLGDHLLYFIMGGGFASEPQYEGWGLANQIIPYCIVLGFLLFGFLGALSTSAMGATAVISVAQKGVKTAGTKGGKLALEKTKNLGRRVREGIASREGVQRIAERMATYAPRGRFGQVAGAPIWAIGRAMGRAVGPSLIEKERKAIDETEKKAIGQRVEAQLADFRKATTNKERIGILSAMIKDKNIDDAMDPDREGIGRNAITIDEIARLYPIAQAREKHQTIRSSFPNIAAANLPPGTILPAGVTPLEYTLERVKAADYENVSRETLENEDFLNAVLQRGMGEHVSRLIAAHQRAAAVALEERLQELASGDRVTPRQYLQNRNPQLYRYFTRGAGRGLIGI